MARHSFIQMSKLHNVKGRISYITSHARQENLYATYRTADNEFWSNLARESQQEFKRSGTEGKCIEARELIIALPEIYTRYEPQEVLEDFTEEFRRRYGVECVSALHHNKRKTNYHIHLIFSERKLLPEPDIKIATRSVFYDEPGKRVRTKKEITGEDGQIRKGCTVIKKGEIYESHLFTVKDDKFKSEPFLREGRLSSEVQHILEERLIRSEPTKAFAGSEVEQSTEGGEISLRDIVQGMAFRNKLPEQPVCVLDRRLFPGRMRMRKVDRYSEFLLHLLALNEFSALVKGNSFNLFAGTLEHSHQLFSDGSGVQPLHFAGQQKPATPVGGGHNGCRAFRAHNRVRFEISDSCAFVRFLRPVRDGTTKADLVSFVRLADLFVFNSQIDPQGIAQESVIQRPVNRRGADAVPLLVLQAIGDLFRRPEQMPQQKTDLVA